MIGLLLRWTLLRRVWKTHPELLDGEAAQRAVEAVLLEEE